MTAPIHQEVTLNASLKQVYEAFLDAKQHSAFTGGAPAEISREVGGAFSCHGGQIVSRHIELLANGRIIQAWRVNAWPAGVYSIVKLELKSEGKTTRVILDQSGIPEGAREHLEGGWSAMYWEPLRRYLA
ncbi:MAG: hypothetical protein EXQ85_08385 [Alphaproteobacteria bacterium]|nr:hypothetical protein [Alphaproteobacteria bacterium]